MSVRLYFNLIAWAVAMICGLLGLAVWDYATEDPFRVQDPFLSKPVVKASEGLVVSRLRCNYSSSPINVSFVFFIRNVETGIDVLLNSSFGLIVPVGCARISRVLDISTVKPGHYVLVLTAATEGRWKKHTFSVASMTFEIVK